MLLTRKLTLAIAVGVALVLGLSGYLQTRREALLFSRDNARDHHVLATRLASAVAEVRRLKGDSAAADVLTQATEPDALRVRWVRLHAGEPGDPPLLPDAARQALLTAKEVRALDSKGAAVTYHPISGGPPALLELSESLAEKDAYTRITVLNTVATSLAVAMVCTLIAYVLGASIVGAPVRQLVDKARRVARGDLNSLVVPRARDELGLLARELNSMCDHLSAAKAKAEAEAAARISALEQLRHADRLATVGKLAAGIAHELGTPLHVIAARAKLIEKEETNSDLTHGSARVIAEQTERMSAIIRQLLDFARERGSQTGNVDLLQLTREAVDLLAPLGKARRVQVQISAASAATRVTLARDPMLQAVMNLIVNAIQASAENSVVEVEVGSVDELPPQAGDVAGPFATITVKDHGRGMTQEVADHAFEPFFTTKDVGEGTGLGLSVAYGVVSEQGGVITVSSKLGQGSEFCVFLPLGAKDSEPKIAKAFSPQRVGSNAWNSPRNAGERLSTPSGG